MTPRPHRRKPAFARSLHIDFVALAFFAGLALAACRPGSPPPAVDLPLPTGVPTRDGMLTLAPDVLATWTPEPPPPPPRLLSICLGREPRSLFLYEATSAAERGVLAAVYDGPFETHDFVVEPVILAKMPSQANGDALLQPVEVQPGETIVDSNGDLVSLEEGVVYRPSGCADLGCAQTCAGDQPVLIDQLSLRFTLLAGVTWSDGAPLRADDSVYSFEVARELFPAVRPDLVSRTQSYRALDEYTVEWVGVPGYQDAPYHAKFFSPLPRHAWGGMRADELSQAEIAARTPLGWGAYVIDEWVPGDHISLHRNPAYFRSGEGLPHFDNLVYRFVADGDEALDAILVGECDLLDQTTMLEAQSDRLLDLQEAGQLTVLFQRATAWDLVMLGIESLDEQRPDYFGLKEVRQALAMCIDRQAMAASLYGGQALVADAYLPPWHSLYNPDVSRYGFDPGAGAALLESVGWLDLDGDPATPRTAQGLAGVRDGTPFEVEYLVSSGFEAQAAARILSDSLAQCGVRVNLLPQSAAEFLAAGPEGPVFGQRFDLAQFAWASALEPPCYLYLSDEIPGPYPEHPKGWGGVNASGYRSPEFDRACKDALFALPDSPGYREAHHLAQAIFAEDLPAIPLYWRSEVIAMRPDMCGVDPSADGALSSLEAFDYAEDCKRP